jgi:DNA gyrase/topoisomerase IV subunit A
MAKKHGLAVESIKDVQLLKFARKKYYEYGVKVLEDRAFPDYRDGFNPVNRRALWSAYELGVRSNAKMVKSARIVGDMLGRFHPHGDAAAYGALVKMTNKPGMTCNIAVGLFDGSGNWGSLVDKSFAAMRYTETRLSKFSDEVLFNKFYLPAVEFVPNYDGSGKEPLLIPALLPIALINGRFGIAPGANTNIPICDYQSVLKALYLIYKGQEITPQFLYKTLRFKSTYGGVEVMPTETEERKLRQQLFTGRTGRALLESVMDYNEASRTVTVTGFARDTEIEKLLETFLDIEGISQALDASTSKDRYAKLVITFKKGLKPQQYEKLLKFVKSTLSSRENYVLNYTERFVNETEESSAKVVSMSLTEMLTQWVKWRTELERKACSYWIKEDEKEIHRLKLLSQAVDLIDLIVKLLRDPKLTAEQVYESYAKKAKVKLEDAKYVLNRPIISLRRLEKKALAEQIKSVETHKSGLEKRRKNPEPFMADQVKGMVKLGVN